MRGPPMALLLLLALSDKNKFAELDLALQFFLGELLLTDRREEEFEVLEEIFVGDPQIPVEEEKQLFFHQVDFGQ